MRRVPEQTRSRVELTPAIVEKIVGLISDWPAQRVLTWDGVVAHVAAFLRHKWTRQGLERHSRIKEAYEAKREEYRQYKKNGKFPRLGLPEHELRLQQVARLTDELQAARRMLRDYDERFVLLQAAALRHGLTLAQIEASLVPLDRGVTDRSPMGSHGGPLGKGGRISTRG